MDSPSSADWPKELTGDLAWTGADFESNTDVFTDKLSSQDIEELNSAIKHFQGNTCVPHMQPTSSTDTCPPALGLSRGHADPTTFPLSQGLAKRLQKVTDHVYNGRGFHRIRGINPSAYTDEECVILYAGITSYIADQRARNIGETSCFRD